MIIMLLLETLLLFVFLVLDILLFYIFFENILSLLFILTRFFSSNNGVKACFCFFLYILLGLLFLLLSIVTMFSIIRTTDFNALFKTNFQYFLQLVFIFQYIYSFCYKNTNYIFKYLTIKS